MRSWNAAEDATAASMVFDPNPVQTSGDTSLTDGPALGVDTDTNTAPDLFRASVTLRPPGEHDVAQRRLRRRHPSRHRCSGNFSRADVNPASASFEAVNAYYAVTEAQKKIQDLGFTDVNNRSVQLLVNADPQDNSNYNPTTQAITYGFGGVDDAEDAEVVIHEYGHAVQDNQVPGFGSGDEQGAMGEGFGDFLAGMLYMNRGDSADQATRRYCIAEWDVTSYNPVDPANPGSGCLRWINGIDESTGADIGQYSNTPDEVHNDGRFWSAGMTCIFEGLGGDLAARDKALKLVHRLAAEPRPDFRQHRLRGPDRVHDQRRSEPLRRCRRRADPHLRRRTGPGNAGADSARRQDTAERRRGRLPRRAGRQARLLSRQRVGHVDRQRPDSAVTT